MEYKKVLRLLLTLILSCAFLLVGTVSIAKTTNTTVKKSVFDITSKIYIDGELVSSPRIISRADQKAVIKTSGKGNNDSLRMELIASDAPNVEKNDAIKINYDVRYKQGKEASHSKLRLIVLPNQPAIIKTTESGHSYEIQVLADRE